MNLRAIANRATSGINRNTAATVQVCIGYTEKPGLVLSADYAPSVPATVQLQALSKRDVEHLDGLNITGAEWSCYSDMQLTAVDRDSQTGGDLVSFANPTDGRPSIWLVTAILEGWAGWCRVALTRQINGG